MQPSIFPRSDLTFYFLKMYRLQCLFFFILIQLLNASAFYRGGVVDYAAKNNINLIYKKNTNEDNTQHLKLLSCSTKDVCNMEDRHFYDKIICQFGPKKNSTKVTFEKILVSDYFCEEDGSPLNPNLPNSVKPTPQMTVYLAEKQRDLITYRILMQDTKELSEINSEFNEKVEFFDYLWIKMKFVLLIVSVYLLEQF